MRALVEDSTHGQLIVEVRPLPDGRPPETVYVEVTGPQVRIAEELHPVTTGDTAHEVFVLVPGEDAIGVDAVYRRTELHPSEAQAHGEIVGW